MVPSSAADSVEPKLEHPTTSDSQRWLRDLGALLALPAMWVDHEPEAIVASLLSVLFGILRLESAYARFEDPLVENSLEIWRPLGPQPPAELRFAIKGDRSLLQGISTADVDAADHAALRVSRLPLALPWGAALVVVSSARSDFPTVTETHLFRVAVSQAGIAIHLAQRLAQERAARVAAEHTMRRQTELLRALVEDVEPSLTSVAHRIKDATRLMAEIDKQERDRPAPIENTSLGGRSGTVDLAGAPAALLPLTRRETEVLGLLAQGLSNREIAGIMWLSDRTVERHITGLYRKIGVARRSEATAFALRHGMGS